jgi:hypothetical protein
MEETVSINVPVSVVPSIAQYIKSSQQPMAAPGAVTATATNVGNALAAAPAVVTAAIPVTPVPAVVAARNSLLTLAFAAVIVLIIMLCFYTPRSLSHKLERNGWTVYSIDGCRFCKQQMAMLRGFTRYTLYDSSGKVLKGYTKDPPVPASKITKYPYWYNSRTYEIRVGLQNKTALGEMAQTPP